MKNRARPVRIEFRVTEQGHPLSAETGNDLRSIPNTQKNEGDQHTGDRVPPRAFKSGDNMEYLCASLLTQGGASGADSGQNIIFR